MPRPKSHYEHSVRSLATHCYSHVADIAIGFVLYLQYMGLSITYLKLCQTPLLIEIRMDVL